MPPVNLQNPSPEANPFLPAGIKIAGAIRTLKVTEINIRSEALSEFKRQTIEHVNAHLNQIAEEILAGQRDPEDVVRLENFAGEFNLRPANSAYSFEQFENRGVGSGEDLLQKVDVDEDLANDFQTEVMESLVSLLQEARFTDVELTDNEAKWSLDLSLRLPQD